MAMNMMDDFLRVEQPQNPPQKPPCDLCGGKGTLCMNIFGGISFACPACVDEAKKEGIA